MRKSVLELGGSDPFIVLEDADLDACIPVAINSRFQNNGQSCIAAKRFIVNKNIAEKFTYKIIEASKKLQMGNPLENGVNIGPIARKDLMEQLKKQLNDSIELGAKVLYRILTES
jgi:succinate-semialdehyde dehydrogenase/glutarate-semialdehyde dehydrogenase